MADRGPLELLVAGTGTGVGKTWVATRLLRELRGCGLTVAAAKPAQSHEPDEEPTDADLLAAATGQDPLSVCPEHRSYPRAMAPPMAAEVLGRAEPRLAVLVDEIRWPEGTEVGLVESAGGVRSPIAADGDTVAFAERLRPDLVVLVADAALGVIHAVRSASDPLAGHAVTVLLNRFDPHDGLHRRNLEWLQERDRLDVVVGPSDLAARAAAWARARFVGS